MKGLILNDLLSIRRMLKTLAGIFLVFMVAWAVWEDSLPPVR